MKEDIKQALLSHSFKNPIQGEKWVKRYIRFIEGCESKEFDYNNEKIHLHHILPRSWGGCDDQSNLIALPVRHHVVAHHLLSYTKDRKMQSAFKIIVQRIFEDKNFNYAASLKLIEISNYMVQRAIINLNTMEEFKSSIAADVYYGLKVGTVCSALCCQCRAGGYFWQYKDVVDQFGAEKCLQYYLDKAEQGRANIIDSIAVPVVDVITGKVFKTSYDADRALGTSEGSVKSCIRAKTFVKGHWFMLQHDIECIGIDRARNEVDNIIAQRQAKRAVVNLNTGDVFESVGDVSRKIGFKTSSIQSAIHNKTKLGGYWWVRKKAFDDIGQQKLLEEYQSRRNKKRTGNYKKCAIINLVDGTIYERGQDADKAYNRCSGWYYSVIKHQRFTDQYYFVPLDEYQHNKQQYDKQFQIWKTQMLTKHTK